MRRKRGTPSLSQGHCGGIRGDMRGIWGCCRVTMGTQGHWEGCRAVAGPLRGQKGGILEGYWGDVGLLWGYWAILGSLGGI